MQTSFRARVKRPSCEVDDIDECTPISKRINFLNLENHHNSNTATAQESCSSQHQPTHPSFSSNSIPIFHNGRSTHLANGDADPTNTRKRNDSNPFSLTNADASLVDCLNGTFTNVDSPSCVDDMSEDIDMPSASPWYCQLLPGDVDPAGWSRNCEGVVRGNHDSCCCFQRQLSQCDRPASGLAADIGGSLDISGSSFDHHQPLSGVHMDAGMAGTRYDPELRELDNPHYYHVNEVLFNLHCQRIARKLSAQC